MATMVGGGHDRTDIEPSGVHSRTPLRLTTGVSDVTRKSLPTPPQLDPDDPSTMGFVGIRRASKRGILYLVLCLRGNQIMSSRSSKVSSVG